MSFASTYLPFLKPLQTWNTISRANVKAHFRSFRYICAHIEALFFCRHNNTSVAVSVRSNRFAPPTLDSQVHTVLEPAGTRHAPRGSKSKFTRTRLQQQQVQNGTELAHTHWQQHQFTYVFNSSSIIHWQQHQYTHVCSGSTQRHTHGKHTEHTRHTYMGTHTAYTWYTHGSHTAHTHEQQQ